MSERQEQRLVLELDRVQPPNMYRVVMLNDDQTTHDFVVKILIQVFHKLFQEAAKITMAVHRNGSAIVGVYPYDIAKTRVTITTEMAQKEGFPLRCLVEKDG